MAIQLQLRRGTAAENEKFIGAEGELTYSTDANGLRIHDGIHEGGFMIDAVVAFQKPTEENNYTWYRKYASGWVEQGGRCLTTIEKPLPITMADSNYTLLALPTRYNANQGTIGLEIMMQDADKFQIGYRWNGTYVQISIPWFVAGYAA